MIDPSFQRAEQQIHTPGWEMHQTTAEQQTAVARVVGRIVGNELYTQLSNS